MSGNNIKGALVIPRSFLSSLVYGFPVLIVAFAVLMGAESLARGTGDLPAARVLWWVAMVCLMGLLTDLVLLVGVLGVESLIRRDQTSDSDDS